MELGLGATLAIWSSSPESKYGKSKTCLENQKFHLREINIQLYKLEYLSLYKKPATAFVLQR